MIKKIQLTALMTGLLATNIAIADDGMLTGKVKLACEAILCLSTGSPPNECSPSLSEYFSIDFDDFSDTIKGRINFLNLCPVSSQTPQMKSLVNAIANGAGRCDAASLNATLQTYITVETTNGYGFGGGQQTISCITGNKPSYCAVYENHEYTDIKVGAQYKPTKTYNTAQNAFGMGSYGSNNSQKITCGQWVE